MTSIDIYRREFGVRSLKQVSFLKERGMGSDLNIQHRIGVIHKKVGVFECACLPVGRDFGLRSAELAQSRKLKRIPKRLTEFCSQRFQTL
jgi:hypothetical protein